ncbi:hypothetical protein [Neobacillus sp. LXY-4]|uniref:hypothetical protein n=1 Tax=Neobacillus sp. LXY-4 TaxID=3379826 RepID=UPI003EE0CF4F
MSMQSKENGDEKRTLTIFTIPEKFVHIETGKFQKVTPEMFRFFQEHQEQNNIVEALMTVVFHHVHGDRYPVNLDRLEMKMEEVLQLLKDKNYYVPAQVQAASALEDLPDQLDDLLDEFAG